METLMIFNQPHSALDLSTPVSYPNILITSITSFYTARNNQNSQYEHAHPIGKLNSGYRVWLPTRTKVNVPDC